MSDRQLRFAARKIQRMTSTEKPLRLFCIVRHARVATPKPAQFTNDPLIEHWAAIGALGLMRV
jgi:hypothetical protein